MFLRPSLIALLLRFWIPLLLASAYAFARGGKPERLAAGLILSCAVLTLLVRTSFSQRFDAAHASVVLVDCGLFLGLAVLAIFANRHWPILMAALHGFPLLGHLARWLNPDMSRIAYAILLSAPQIPIIVLLAVATWRHRRRVSTTGIDPDWRRSSDRSRTQRS